jgi:hypothetical protein
MSVEGPERFTGGCLCGSVRIVASGRPYRVGVCHCLDCRKHRPSRHPASGSPVLEDLAPVGPGVYAHPMSIGPRFFAPGGLP